MAKFIVVLAFLGAAIAVGSAASLDEKNNAKNKVLPILQECATELGISKEQLLAARAAKNIDGVDPCYYACFFKKIGFIDEAGNYNAAVAKEKVDKFLSDPEDLNKAVDVADNCGSVNGATVSDGAKGCERAKLLTSCLAKELHGYKNLLTAH